MNHAQLLIYGALLAAANVAGGLFLTSPLLKSSWREKALVYLIAVGAGFMLAATFIEIVPEVANLWIADARPGVAAPGIMRAMIILLAGYLLIHFVEHTIAPHFHFGAETHPELVLRPAAAYTALGGLTIHTFFDGASIAAAFLVNFKTGLLVFIAILLHKLPEGFTAASIVLASGRSHAKARAATLVIGIATLAGVLAVIVLENKIHNAVAYALPLSAGVTLYVAASDLIPEINHKEEKNPFLSLAVFGGVAFFYLLHRVFEV